MERTEELIYTINKASFTDIYEVTRKCNDDFPIPLNGRVDLKEYMWKIYENAVCFEVWEGSKLIGMLGAYYNDKERRRGFFSHICVLRDYVKLGIATQLCENCLRYGVEHDFDVFALEVNIDNKASRRLCEKEGFVEVDRKGNYIYMERVL